MNSKDKTLREKGIQVFERMFKAKTGLEFPLSYRQFLLEQGSAVIDGYRILGIPREEKQEELLDIGRIKQDTSCPICQKRKQKGKIVCYDCYQVYVEETSNALAEGRKILSLPQWLKERIPQREKKGKKELSVVQATEILRKNRPDLSRKLIAICFNRERVMCLDTEKKTDEDCPLIDVSLKKNEPSLHPRERTFKEWFKIHQGYEKRFREAYSRVQRRRKEIEEQKERKFGGKKGLLPRPKDWHPIKQLQPAKGCFFCLTKTP